MSYQLPTHYVQQYSSNVQLLLQQKGSKLSGLVSRGSYTGKQASVVDQYGAVTARRRTTKYQPITPNDVPADRRWVYPADYDWAAYVDNLDKLRMIIDPQSSYVQNAVYAMGRAMDDAIIDAMFAAASTGETGATSTSFLSGNVIGVNTGGAASDLNVSKLREGLRLLMSHEVDLEAETPYCVITSQQHDALLNEIQVVSTDFNSQPVLVDGKVKRFLGIEFVHCERLDTGTDDQSGTSRAVPLFVKSGLHLGEWDAIGTSVDQRKDLEGHPWQVYAKGTFGATRIEEKKVVKIWCRES